jgi:GNAT superfamily N-acetyltransferase
MAEDLTVRHYDAVGAQSIAEQLIVPIYEASHADVLANPFYDTRRFLERLAGYTQRDGFELVVGSVSAGAGDQPAGLAFGYTLPPTTRWWEGLVTPVPEGFTDEDGTRTFAFNELMVHPRWQRRGIARALHDALLAGRPERRATLLVRADNTPARTAYLRWGWQTVAQLQPFPDAPVFDAMVLPLGQP